MTCTSSYSSGSSSSRLCLSMALRMTAGALSWLVTWVGEGADHQGAGPGEASRRGQPREPLEMPHTADNGSASGWVPGPRGALPLVLPREASVQGWGAFPNCFCPPPPLTSLPPPSMPSRKPACSWGLLPLSLSPQDKGNNEARAETASRPSPGGKRGAQGSPLCQVCVGWRLRGGQRGPTPPASITRPQCRRALDTGSYGCPLMTVKLSTGQVCHEAPDPV